MLFLPTEEEIDWMQKMYDYAESNFEDDFKRRAKECPYDTNFEDPELVYKQMISWFVTEWVIPSTGRTVLEDFVERHVSDPGIARKLMQMKEVVRGPFDIIDAQLPRVALKNIATGVVYETYPKEGRVNSNRARAFYRKGDVINGRIHAWGSTYLTAGIITRKLDEGEIARKLGLITNPMLIMEWFEKKELQKAEAILVRENTTLQSAMNKYPATWVDHICKTIGVSTKGKKEEKIRSAVSKLESGYVEDLLAHKLPAKSVNALSLIAQNGYVIKYSRLAKRFSTEIGFFWEKNSPASDVGNLRSRGLVVVGRTPEGGRLYKVALIPLELRAPITRFFHQKPHRSNA